MQWITQAIVADLKSMPGVVDVKVYGPGGDYDTDNIIISNKDDYRLYISGYEYDTSIEPTGPSDNRDIFSVVVTDGQDSIGGCNSDEEEDTKMYHAVRRYFKALGADVANNYDVLF